MTSYLQNQKSYQPHILRQECFYGYNNSRKVSLQSVDVNLDRRPYLPTHKIIFCQKAEAFISNFQFMCREKSQCIWIDLCIFTKNWLE